MDVVILDLMSPGTEEDWANVAMMLAQSSTVRVTAKVGSTRGTFGALMSSMYSQNC
jgi:hypothetical protein